MKFLPLNLMDSSYGQVLFSVKRVLSFYRPQLILMWLGPKFRELGIISLLLKRLVDFRPIPFTGRLRVVLGPLLF